MIDNAACVHILEKPTLAPKLQRWALTLQDFTIEYLAGPYNVVTDALSRNIPETVDLVTSLNPRQIKIAQKTYPKTAPLLQYLRTGKLPENLSVC